MKINFETERLRIRPLTPDDAEVAFRWCGDPKVNTYMIYPLYHRVEDVRTWLESRNADDPDNYDEGIVLKSTAEKLGYRSCWYEGHITDADRIGDRMAEILNVPEEYELVCMLPIGVPADKPSTPKKKAFGERAWFNSFGSDTENGK